MNRNVPEAIKSFENYLTYQKGDEDNILLFIQNVSTYICNIIEEFKELCVETSPKQQKFIVLTYLTQYYSIYEFLKKSYCSKKHDKDVCNELKKYVVKQFLSLCHNQETFGNTVGSFISLMDTALEKIAEVDAEKDVIHAVIHLKTSSTLVEEILCFSMSVAQVGFSKDSKIITASCQAVLRSMDNLKAELEKEDFNLAMCNLLKETYSNSLCVLEAKVNLVVLNLCLKSFSDYHTHIEKLYDACMEITNKSALDFVISNFDLYMDRIFQIGLFSLACSSTNKRSMEITVLLANLQFLEQELVPAFMASSLKCRKGYANLFKKYWCSQIKSLQMAVHNIIEPEAYCKLILEELNQNLERIWNCVLKDESIQKDMMEPFINYTKELGKMIRTCINSFDCDVREKVRKELRVVYNVLQEVEVTTNVFLDETLNTTTVRQVNDKIFKRSKILVKSVKSLWTCIKNNEDESTSFFDEETEQTHTTEDDRFKTIIEKSQQIIKDRSIRVTFHLDSKLNLTTNLNRTKHFRRHLKFKDSYIDNDALECGFDEFQKSFYTIASINEEDLLS